MTIDRQAHLNENLMETGVSLLGHGKFHDALAWFEKALAIDPEDVIASYNAGVACHGMQDHASAVGYYRRAIKHYPEFVAAHHNLAQALAAQHQYPAAIQSYLDALGLDPSDFNSAFNLSLLYQKIGDSRQAIQACRLALHAKPDFADAFALLGMIYRELEMFDEAVVSLEQALLARPDLTEARFNLGIVLQKMGQYEAGLAQYRSAMQSNSNFAPAHWLYRLSLPMIYDTPAQIEKYRDKFRRNLNQLTEQTPLQTSGEKQFALDGIGTTTNFYLQYQCRNDIDLQRQYGRFVHRVMSANYPEWTRTRPMPDLAAGEPLRIGYVSTFMYNHTIGTFLSGWLEKHSKKHFQLHCYHVGKKIDGTTEVLRNNCHYFHHFTGDVESAARQILLDRLHILVYCDIGMDPATTQLAALQLAPIQCKGWGHPVTTGLPTIDYYLSSDLMEPQNAQDHYTESLVRLPNLALGYRMPALPQPPKTREQLGLPSDRFIYLSTQSVFKYLPQHDDIYPRIALEADRACFVFISNQSKAATRRFRNRLDVAFRRYGLNSRKFCHFSPKLNYADFLSLNMAADVILDTFEWSGGKTTLEALSCGIPVVTCPGRFMRGRHAYAMLRMMDVTETICNDKSMYCRIAVSLANHSLFYRDVKNKITENRAKLYDDSAFMTALEAFYRSLVEQRLQQLPHPSSTQTSRM